MFKQPKSMMEKFRQMSDEDRANMAREIHEELREQYKTLVPTIGMDLEPLFEESIPVATSSLDASAHVNSSLGLKTGQSMSISPAKTMN